MVIYKYSVDSFYLDFKYVQLTKEYIACNHTTYFPYKYFCCKIVFLVCCLPEADGNYVRND